VGGCVRVCVCGCGCMGGWVAGCTLDIIYTMYVYIYTYIHYISYIIQNVYYIHIYACIHV
jgi:hypothetical protein